jgi:hypothetical protein
MSKFIVTVHGYPGTPKAYPVVEAPDAQSAIKIVRESIGHSFTMRAADESADVVNDLDGDSDHYSTNDFEHYKAQEAQREVSRDSE